MQVCAGLAETLLPHTHTPNTRAARRAAQNQGPDLLDGQRRAPNGGSQALGGRIGAGAMDAPMEVAVPREGSPRREGKAAAFGPAGFQARMATSKTLAWFYLG